jgi:hypothetical protein
VRAKNRDFLRPTSDKCHVLFQTIEVEPQTIEVAWQNIHVEPQTIDVERQNIHVERQTIDVAL